MLSLTATELPRFMVCNGSILLESPELDIERDTTVKDEGIAAHWLVEQVHKGMQPDELIDRQAPNGVYITGEMVEYLEDYITAVTGNVECDTSYSTRQFEIKGRADHIVLINGHLFIDDLKYGWSIVEPEMNWTLISHAIAFIQGNNEQVDKISFTIYQPRPYHSAGNIRVWTITHDELIKLQSDMVRALTNPSDTLQTSGHCRNCSALTVCPAVRKAQYNAIDVSEKAFTDTLDNNQLAKVYDDTQRAIEMLKLLEKAYVDLIEHRVRKGEIVGKYILEKSISNRQWKKNITPEFLEAITGKDLTEKKLITPTQAEKAGVSKEIVASMTERVNRGVKLVKTDINAKVNKLFKGS